MSSDDVPQRGQHPALSRQPEPTPRSSLPTSPPPYPQLAIAALAADPVIERLRAEVERLRAERDAIEGVIRNVARDLYTAEVHFQGVGWDEHCTYLLVRSQHSLAEMHALLLHPEKYHHEQ